MDQDHIDNLKISKKDKVKVDSLTYFFWRLTTWCVLPLVLLSVLLAIQYVHTLKTASNREASNLVNNVATTVIDPYIKSQIAALQMLADSPLVDDPARWNQLYREAQSFRNRFGGHVILADLSMQMRFNTRVAFGATLPKLPKPSGHAAAPTVLTTGQPAVSDTFLGPIAKESLVAVAVPVIRADQIQLLLLSTIETRRLQQHLEKVELASGWSLYLVDGKGDLIAKKSQNNDAQLSPEEQLSGRWIVRSSLTPWSLILDISPRIFNRPIFIAATALLLAIMVAVLISILAGRFAGRRLTRSLSSLVGPLQPVTPEPHIEEIESIHRTLWEAAAAKQTAETILQESEKKLREAQKMARLGYWTWDIHSGAVEWSEEVYAIFDIDPNTFKPDIKSILAFSPWPEDHERDKELIRRAKESRETGDYEQRFLCRDGSAGYYYSTFQGRYDQEGNLITIVGTILDITKRKRAEEELLKSESHLRTLVQTIPDLVWLKDREGTYLSCNPMFERFYGAKQEDIVGKTDYDFVDRELADFMRELDRKAIEAGKPIRNEKWGIFADTGQRVLLETIKTPMLDAHGALIGILGIGHDITERKQAEDALLESETRLKFVLDGAQLGYWDWNIATGAVNRNARWAEMLGYTMEEVEFSVKQWTDLHHPDDRALAWESINNHLEGRTSAHEIEYRMLTKDGQYKWILDQAKVVSWDAQGKPLRMCGTHTDITERKLAEQEREKLQTQLSQAQKMESVGRLAGGVAHDFNNMLSVILGYSELVLDRADLSDSLQKEIGAIYDAARRSADIVRQLLAFARQQTVAPQVLDVNEIIESMLKMLRRLIGEDIDLAWLPGAKLGPVKIDPSQLDQLLANLCVNARDAIEGVGKVTIETGMVDFDEVYCADHAGFIPGEFIVLSVSDDGCGMGHDTVDKIFEPFFTTKELGQGTGLGLSTVYGIIKQNNGFINVYSEPGHGTTFRIYLPRYQGDILEINEKVINEILSSHNETILVVEDEVAILQLAQTMLEKLGYTVLTAASPGEAVKLATSHTAEIHLLITDVVMPEMNGRDLSAQLQALYPGLKTLFMSGYTANVIAHRGILDDGVCFIQKPFSSKDFAVKVRNALENR